MLLPDPDAVHRVDRHVAGVHRRQRVLDVALRRRHVVHRLLRYMLLHARESSEKNTTARKRFQPHSPGVLSISPHGTADSRTFAACLHSLMRRMRAKCDENDSCVLRDATS